MTPDDAHAQRLRGIAHGRLCDWGQHRDAALAGLGFAANSVTERMRERLQGGGASTRAHQLNSVEGAVFRHGKTLQTENAVRALRPKIREAIHARYALDRSMAVWATEVGISAESARKRISRGLLEVGSLLAQWRPCEPHGGT
jgi:DNA-directed RNA polymerase specialized sigma24 family protein